MDVPDEFKALMAHLADRTMLQAYADIGCTPLEFFLDHSHDRTALKRIDDYLAFVLQHPDRKDKASALWKTLDKYGKFSGVNRPLAFFEEMRGEIRKRIGAPE